MAVDAGMRGRQVPALPFTIIGNDLRAKKNNL